MTMSKNDKIYLDLLFCHFTLVICHPDPATLLNSHALAFIPMNERECDNKYSSSHPTPFVPATTVYRQSNKRGRLNQHNFLGTAEGSCTGY